MSAEIKLQEMIRAKAISSGEFPKRITVSMSDFCDLRFKGAMEYIPESYELGIKFCGAWLYCGVIIEAEKPQNQPDE